MKNKINSETYINDSGGREPKLCKESAATRVLGCDLNWKNEKGE